MQFSRLAEYFEELEATSSRKALVQILASLFGEVETGEIDKVTYLCQGRLVPFFEPLEIGMGEKLVAEGLAQAAGVSRDEVLTAYAQLGDLGLVAAELAARRADALADGEPPTIADIYDGLYQVATASGDRAVERKVGIFADLVRRVDAKSAKYLTRIPLGRLRLGVGDPTLLDAFSQARLGDTSMRKALERAYNETSDLGLVARVFWEGGADAVAQIHVQVGKPLRPALAERLPSAEAVIEKLGRCAAEPKLDGFRCQVHKNGDEIRIFSRNLEDMTPMFPELIDGARRQIRATTAIVEGEAVAYHPESEEFLPFQETTKRRRKYGIEEMAASLPLRLFLFDAMHVDGEDLTPLSYRERRKRLEALIDTDDPSDTLAVTELIETDNPEELRTFLLDCIGRGLEGVVVKKLDSPYQAGARNFNWIKLKRNNESHLQDTVDCVILGYIFGRGKRAAFGVGALLAGVYDRDRDEFVTITRIGTGLTDREWQEIRERCDQLMAREKPARVNSLIEPSVWVEPRVVIEVLADEITRSPVHTAGKVDGGAGYALRFPRLVSFRGDDKRPEDATTVQEIVEMYEQQGAKK